MASMISSTWFGSAARLLCCGRIPRWPCVRSGLERSQTVSGARKPQDNNQMSVDYYPTAEIPASQVLKVANLSIGTSVTSKGLISASSILL